MPLNQKSSVTPYLPAEHYTIWRLIKAYFQSDERWFAYGFSMLIISLTVSLVGLDLVFNYWYSHFYDALQAYDKPGVLRLLFYFCGIAVSMIIIAVYRYYITQFFNLRWRKWLTNQFVGRWLQNRSYYLLENFDEKTDNPDQRIQEDVTAIISNTIDLVVGVLGAFMTLFTFIFVLWSLSGHLTLSFGSFGKLVIPGYLVWVGVLYASIGTYLTVKIGRPLVALNFEQQKREATFRYAAVEVRTHAEHIALYEGEHHQKTILNGLFDLVLSNYYLIILRQKLLLWFTAGYNQAAVIIPLIVALPNYFGKVFKLGGLIQSLNAFGKVQESLSFIVNAYTQIAQWQAIAQRLTTFVNHMNEAEAKAAMQNKLLFETHDANDIEVKNMTLYTPHLDVLLRGIHQTFKQGHAYLIKGDSGIGKSTFVRAMAGIWPYAAGQVIFPKQAKVMYLPQQPYMPVGTLEEAILFPDHHKPELRSRIEAVMQLCNLAAFIPRLNQTLPWAEQLSPGEQQRVAFARVLLHRPDWVFLDESTSMLDKQNEALMYGLIKAQLPDCTVISVGHRDTLTAYHDVVVNMADYRASVPATE
ncbi:MAG TPA: ABC transporter ATP-binding protein/permease [Gammaproteobacteria bacterium]|nr:ABC transporter ATP-binding protein/permease [Gammaproteobacteria bacterium]